MISELDRIYALHVDENSWVCRTNGYGAVLSPGVAEAKDIHASTPKEMGGLVQRIREAKTDVVDRKRFEKFLEVLCATCKNKRSKRCQECLGTGKITRECSHCDESHECVCDCGDGRIACTDCSSRAVVMRKIGAFAFDAYVVSLVVSQLPKGELSMGTIGELLVFRVDEVFGVAMKCFDAPTESTPIWTWERMAAR